MGTGSTSIPARLDRGEAIDVVIVADGDLEQLMKAGRIRPGTRVDLARSAIGMAVRRGAPKPDISSVDALRRTLLEAKSIAHSASVSGAYLSTELFQQLGIADRVLPKSRRIEGERVGAVVARGEAENRFPADQRVAPRARYRFGGTAAIGRAASDRVLCRHRCGCHATRGGKELHRLPVIDRCGSGDPEQRARSRHCRALNDSASRRRKSGD